MDLYSLCNKEKRRRININKSNTKRNTEKNDCSYNLKSK